MSPKDEGSYRLGMENRMTRLETKVDVIDRKVDTLDSKLEKVVLTITRWAGALAILGVLASGLLAAILRK